MVDSEYNVPITDNFPLSGQRILVTRPATGTGDRLNRLLAEAGADVVAFPVIEFRPPPDWTAVDDAITNLTGYDWIVFVSANGVSYFLDRCEDLGIGEDQWSAFEIAAIGEATAKVLQNAGLDDVLVPKTSDSCGMAEALIEVADQQRVLVVRANRGSSVLSKRLREAGINFREVVVYHSIDVTVAEPKLLQQLDRGFFDWVTVTSSAISRAIVNLFGDSLKGAKLASISPTTSRKLEELGFKPAVEAQEYNMQGVFQSIVEYQPPGM